MHKAFRFIIVAFAGYIFISKIFVGVAFADTSTDAPKEYVLAMSEDDAICKPLTDLYNRILHHTPKIVDADFPGDPMPEYLFKKKLRSIGLIPPPVPPIFVDGMENISSWVDKGLGFYYGDVLHNGVKQYFLTNEVEMHDDYFGATIIFKPGVMPKWVHEQIYGHYDPNTVEEVVEISDYPWWVYTVPNFPQKNQILAGRNYTLKKWVNGLTAYAGENATVPLGPPPIDPFPYSVQRAYISKQGIVFIVHSVLPEGYKDGRNSSILYKLNKNGQIHDICYIASISARAATRK